MCWPGSHRGRCSYGSGIGVGAPAPGAKMCLPGSHRGRCSYRNETVVGAPAPGANMCWLRFALRAVLLQEPDRGRSTRPGCENVLAPVRTEGGAPTGAESG